MNVPAPTLERIITDTVLAVVGGQEVPADAEIRPTRPAICVPVIVRGDADARALVRWIRGVCAVPELRELFIDGSLVIDVAVMPAHEAPADQTAVTVFAPKSGAPVVSDKVGAVVLTETVVTEAVLRRLGVRGHAVQMAVRTVVTPAALDYARSAGIRIDRCAT